MFKASTFLLLLRSYAIGQEPMKSMYPSVGPSRSGCIESLTSWTEQEIFSVQNIRYLQRDDMQYITCIPSNQYMKNDLTFDDMQDILHSKPFNCLTPSKAMQVAASSAISIYLRLFLHIIILLKKSSSSLRTGMKSGFHFMRQKLKLGQTIKIKNGGKYTYNYQHEHNGMHELSALF